ncbi:MAG: hypothetical protein BAA01_03640 [Bacillus thermozeamaize]|jgi:hypothetical protein|uniref:DUF3679 domain-containing protein n=1 Tax=Bacillus thermozeamaize TaxID=230954 RepID=A0A1Y3PQL7_9BACI|nr:MAG: hypothetical protein BAA01_03640 [Bacillus thermozeamaize]
MRTFLVSFFLLFLLFLGIFIGIQYAEYGIHDVEGRDEPPKGAAVAVNAEGEVVELSLLGKTFTREEFAAIRGDAQNTESLDEEAASGNMYEELGRILGTWVEQGARGLAEMLLGWLDGLM